MAVNQEPLQLAVGVTWVTFLTQHPPEVVLGAFTGAVIFLLGSANKPKWQWLLFFTVAFLCGVLGAKPIGELVSGAVGLIGIKIAVPMGLGAMVAASCVINVIVWLRDNPTAFLAKFLPKKAAKEDAQ